MRLWELVDVVRRTKTMDFEWMAEACYWLLRRCGVDMEARSMVVEIVEEVEGEFRRSVGRWRTEGFSTRSL